jgi:hypothetical protein
MTGLYLCNIDSVCTVIGRSMEHDRRVGNCLDICVFLQWRPEFKRLFGVSEIITNGCKAVILGVKRKIMGVLTVSFFLVEESLW